MYPAKSSPKTGTTPFSITLASRTGDAPSPNRVSHVGAGERFEVVHEGEGRGKGQRLLVRAPDRAWYAWVDRQYVDLD